MGVDKEFKKIPLEKIKTTKFNKALVKFIGSIEEGVIVIEWR